MLNMKKLITIAAALLLGFAANAQVISTLGYTFDWAPMKNEGRNFLTCEMSGLYAGALYNYVLADFGLGVAGGAYVSFTTGTDRVPNYGKDVLREGNYITREGHRHIAITIPAYVTFTKELGPGALFAYAGPAFQGGLLFQQYTKTNFEGNHFSGNYFYRNYPDRPCDLKVSFGAGYRWKFLQFDLGFDFGLIDRDPSYDYSYRIHTFKLGVSYVY